MGVMGENGLRVEVGWKGKEVLKIPAKKEFEVKWGQVSEGKALERLGNGEEWGQIGERDRSEGKCEGSSEIGASERKWVKVGTVQRQSNNPGQAEWKSKETHGSWLKGTWVEVEGTQTGLG